MINMTCWVTRVNLVKDQTCWVWAGLAVLFLGRDELTMINIYVFIYFYFYYYLFFIFLITDSPVAASVKLAGVGSAPSRHIPIVWLVSSVANTSGRSQQPW